VDIPNLQECRSVSDYAAVVTSVETRLAEIDKEFTGKQFDDESRTEFADLQRVREQAIKVKTELVERAAYIETVGTDETKTERAAVARTLRPDRTHVPENIYDLRSYRNLSSSETQMSQALRDGAMKALESTRSWPNPKTDVPATENKIARLLDHADTEDKELARRILATGDPAYQRAFAKLVKSGGNASVLDADEQRGTALTIGGTGQYLVPFAFDPTIIAIGVHNMNPYRASCRKVEVVGASVWHAVTATAVTAVRGIENLVASEQGPTFAQPSFTPTTVKAQIVMSEETTQDRPDVVSDLSVLIAEAKDNEEEATFAIGANTTTTIGVVGMCAPHSTSGAFTEVTTTTGGGSTVAIADLYKLENALPIRHRPNAQWYMARATIRKFQGFETVNGILFNAIQTLGNGNGVAYPAVGNPDDNSLGNTGLTLLGHPIWESPTVPVATGANVVITTLANPQQFVIVDRVGMTIQFIPFVFSAGTIYVAGQTAIYASWRNAGGPLNVDAGRMLTYLT
jgi:HK97 family phage major capsid protein